MNDHTPTPTDIAEARARFVELCGEYSYTESVKIMGEEYPRGHALNVWQALQCSGQLKPPAGVAAGTHKADPQGRPNLYANLHRNAAEGA